MRPLLKLVLSLFAICIVVVVGAWFWGGRMAGPALQLRQPDKFIGQATPLELMVESPGGKFSRVAVTLEQNGTSFPVVTLDQQSSATVKQETADRLYVMRQVGRKTMPDLQNGQARIVVHAAR